MCIGLWVSNVHKTYTQSTDVPVIGVPFNDTSNWRLGIIERGDAILGDYLVGIQAGNEPDLYAKHGHRPAVRSCYSPGVSLSNYITGLHPTKLFR